MSRIILTTICLAFFVNAYSQQNDTTYHDITGALTIRSFAQYYRVGIINRSNYNHGNNFRSN
ncbi:MAG: hypothetical protein HOP08_04790 [Cyclobacteriaceae bacterium]|nr:hypothetical protein [Cyclobacteriaceae bacterium]